MSEPGQQSRAEMLLELADDELVLGWRNSEWTGIAPDLEEDVAFSSIAQNEIGHARALYALAAEELGTDADALAFDRDPSEYRCAPLCELRLVPDWGRTIARHLLYELADEVRIEALKSSDDVEVAGLAAKIDREETYHRMHAQMWLERLLGSAEGRARLEAGVGELWPYALGVLPEEQRATFVERAGEQLHFAFPERVSPVERGEHSEAWTELWEDMTSVRRSVAEAAW